MTLVAKLLIDNYDKNQSEEGKSKEESDEESPDNITTATGSKFLTV